MDGSGLIVRPEARPLACPHGKAAAQCGRCTEAGRQYEVDQDVLALAGGVSAQEWVERGRRMKREEVTYRLRKMRPEARSLRDSAQHCFDLARELDRIEKAGVVPRESPIVPASRS